MDAVTNYITFHPAFIVMGLALAVTALAMVAEQRRSRRAQIDRVGFMPWRGIMMASLFIAMGSAILGIKG